MSDIPQDHCCDQCGRSTAPGSGLFINRIPADCGWLCADCQCVDCDRCGHQTLEYWTGYDIGGGDYSFADRADRVCDDCLTPAELSQLA